MPFGPYTDFADCVKKNRHKGNPEAYCAVVHQKITGQWPGEMRAIAARKAIRGRKK